MNCIIKTLRIKHIFRFTRITNSKAGQGTLEYILLLMIVVGVMFGMVYQFNDAFAKWSQNYFGKYVACLLEYGELPSLGGGNSAMEGCDAEFEAFSLANGRNPMGEGKDAGKNGSDRDKAGGNQASAGNGDSYGSGGSGAFGRKGFGNSSRRGGANGGRVAAAGNAADNDDGSGDSDFFDRRARAGTLSEKMEEREEERQQQIAIGSVSETEAKKAADKKPPAKAQQGNGLRPNRLAYREMQGRKTASATDSDMNMSFGGFIRFIFITGIIIAIIILIGGQALQISKEWD